MSNDSPPPIIDADGHIVEPDAAWTDYLDPRFMEFVPKPVVEGDSFHFRSGTIESFRMQARPESLASPREAGGRSGGGQAA
jgi:hypothetical protein